MKQSKRRKVLKERPVNKDGYINEWPEMGFVAMNNPYDPAPSIVIVDEAVVELDGVRRKDFDFIDQFIADYAIHMDKAEQMMKMYSLEIARKIVDINVSRNELLEIASAITPAKMV